MRSPSQMQYAKYETDIVHKYGVELAGWPHDTFVLDRLSRESLQEVVDGLVDKAVRQGTEISNGCLDGKTRQPGADEEAEETC